MPIEISPQNIGVMDALRNVIGPHLSDHKDQPDVVNNFIALLEEQLGVAMAVASVINIPDGAAPHARTHHMMRWLNNRRRTLVDRIERAGSNFLEQAIKDNVATADRTAPDPKTTEDFMGTHEVAEHFGITKQVLGNWRTRKNFPEPFVQLAMGPVWKAETIRALKASDFTRNG